MDSIQKQHIKRKNLLLYFLFLSILISQPSYSDSYIKYQKTGGVVKVIDPMLKSEAEKIIDFIYKNFKSIKKNNIDMFSFSDISEIHFWPKYWNNGGGNVKIAPNPSCTHMALFKKAGRSRDAFNFRFANLCLTKVGKTYKVQDSIHWID